MRLIRIKRSAIYLVAVICMFSSGAIGAADVAQSEQPISQTDSIDERMNLYKRIKLEQNKKALIQLLHDIADIQKQCKDKGYLCNLEGITALNPHATDFGQPPPQADDTVSAKPINHSIAPAMNLLGIVGGRARFRLEDGRVQDFSLDESVADVWQVSEIDAETATLMYREKPDIKVLYKIHRQANLINTD